jgi:hypothetical protein
MVKVMNHRIEKLSTFLDAADTELNASNISEIPIERENAINEANRNSGSSSKRCKVTTSFNEHSSEI